MAQQLWVKIDEEIYGPFSAEQFRQEVAAGKIVPDYLVSVDKTKWVKATSVKGIRFPDPPTIRPSAAISSGLTVLDDEPLAGLSGNLWDDLPTEQPFASGGAPVNPLGNASPMGFPANTPIAGGALPGTAMAGGAAFEGKMLSVKWRLGTLLGALGGIVCLIATCFFPVLLSVALGGLPFSEVISMFAVLLCLGLAVTLPILGLTGSTTKLMLSSGLPPGSVECTVTRWLSFVPVWRSQVTLTNSDHLLISHKDGSANQTDIVFLCIMIVLILIGVCPGLLFWLIWKNTRDNEGTCCRVKMTLMTRQSRQSIVLFSENVKDYYATRFGDPAEFKEIRTFLGGAVNLSMLEDYK